MADEVADFQIRHGTQDQEVFDEVVRDNQYQLADAFPPDSLVIDIGANIGCFAVACLLRGASTVVCFEPSPANFKQLTHNLSPWPAQAAAFLSAVWVSGEEQEVSFANLGGGTAAGCCFPTKLAIAEQKPERVNTIGLDEIISQCTNNGERRIQLLKIDAEFSEYPILYSSKRLDLVDEIVGETHEFHEQFASHKYYHYQDYENTAADIYRFLVNNGFVVTMIPEDFSNQTNTLFFARRPTAEANHPPTPETA